ncbi:uncharacterized protein MYCFIDRAFT_176785 [Pseudocercospora fijiensis CIRAD86]|uniref:Uncharacterized protein n=1 Tax=Pseudocercospora fijiensis (strain CIRAD86) TaxID=383855 RepID=M2ZR05_PSEFD|nr:uncharacterized protein MYCFIDRAFT_176785 [Pseudocercospora fijiensis CIRAD86]EME81504.1 hypothetical protein MYCFIDRAFT_176785 [Pseudocercospora fijiensis CIRAD86]
MLELHTWTHYSRSPGYVWTLRKISATNYVIASAARLLKSLQCRCADGEAQRLMAPCLVRSLYKGLVLQFLRARYRVRRGGYQCAAAGRLGASEISLCATVEDNMAYRYNMEADEVRSVKKSIWT